MSPQTSTALAYGRVNLIGEHTDYNGGWVLPTAIPQFTRAKVTPRDDRTVIVAGSPDPKRGDDRPRETRYDLGEETRVGSWTDYVQGVTSVLGKAGGETARRLRGFSLSIESTVPEGSGLSSSAALEISTLKALRSAFDLPIDDVEIARLGQRVENEFVGARVGIMDQMACSFAKAGEALFLDTLTLTYENVKIPLDRVDLVVVNSGVSHSLAGGGGYNQRRAECEEACRLLGVGQLRDLGVSDLPRIQGLPDPFRRRAKHVITENERVHQAVAALREENLPRLGELFFASHASMRDDYEVSVPEIDLLVELARKQPDVYGARLTGGGFGGSIVAIAKAGRGRAVAEAVAEAYRKESGRSPTILVPDAGP
jgi:galactokinase